jgi:hypothetical protein
MNEWPFLWMLVSKMPLHNITLEMMVHAVGTLVQATVMQLQVSAHTLNGHYLAHVFLQG